MEKERLPIQLSKLQKYLVLSLGLNEGLDPVSRNVRKLLFYSSAVEPIIFKIWVYIKKLRTINVEA
jgi:hypothetical protein